MKYISILPIALIVLSSAACDKAGGMLPSGADSEPVTMTEKSDYQVTFEGKEAEASFFMRGHNNDGKEPLFLSISFSKLDEGSVVSIADTTKTADDYGSLHFEVNVVDKVAEIPLTDLINGRVELDIPMMIRMAGHKKGTFKVPKLKVGRAVAATLATVTDRPVSFKGEGPGKAGAKSLASVKGGTSFGELKVMGPAKTLADIDYVGVRSQVQTNRTKKCDGYKKIKGGVTIKMVDYKVELYDRREGKLLTQHTVKAKDRCPMFVSVDKKTRTANTYASDEGVEKWLREQLRELSEGAATNADTVGKK